MYEQFVTPFANGFFFFSIVVCADGCLRTTSGGHDSFCPYCGMCLESEP